MFDKFSTKGSNFTGDIQQALKDAERRFKAGFFDTRPDAAYYALPDNPEKGLVQGLLVVAKVLAKEALRPVRKAMIGKLHLLVPHVPVDVLFKIFGIESMGDVIWDKDPDVSAAFRSHPAPGVGTSPRPYRTVVASYSTEDAAKVAAGPHVWANIPTEKGLVLQAVSLGTIPLMQGPIRFVGCEVVSTPDGPVVRRKPQMTMPVQEG